MMNVEHLLKTSYPISLSDLGIVTDVNPVQFLKALYRILFFCKRSFAQIILLQVCAHVFADIFDYFSHFSISNICKSD